MKMSISRNNATSNARGFTLIEMIGVLAVIAILAAVLIPKVFSAINNARINNTAMTIQTVKTAVVDHYAKYSSLNAGFTIPPTAITFPTNEYDGVLLNEGLLDKPFAVKIGDGLVATNASATVGATIMLDTASAPNTTPSAPLVPTESITTAAQAAFNLSGTPSTGTNYATGSAVVYAIITGVAYGDALQLKQTIDGTSPNLAETTPGSVSLNGRVKYDFTASSSAPSTVYVYITSR